MLDEAQLEELFKRTSVVHADDGAELELAYTFSGTDEPDGIFDDDEFDAKQALYDSTLTLSLFLCTFLSFFRRD